MKKVMLVAMLLGFAQSDAMLHNRSVTDVTPNVSSSRLFANSVIDNVITVNNQDQTKQPIIEAEEK